MSSWWPAQARRCTPTTTCVSLFGFILSPLFRLLRTSDKESIALSLFERLKRVGRACRMTSSYAPYYIGTIVELMTQQLASWKLLYFLKVFPYQLVATASNLFISIAYYSKRLVNCSFEKDGPMDVHYCGCFIHHRLAYFFVTM